MPINFSVTNTQPAVSDCVSEDCLSLFQDYFSENDNIAAKDQLPFEHQAKVFNLASNGEEAFLVAGTASGKTLAIAVPLFVKLKTGIIHRILFIYPTVALLEDQLNVMKKLGKLTGLEIGYIRGGMNRSALISALIKPVILATPDAIYWFFRKNVKYSGLLIYSLCQIDEFVLDEAHLFNGLILKNFEHLWHRIKTLANQLDKKPRLHILTATPTEELKRLNNSEPILGKSKCSDVHVEFKAVGRFDLSEKLVKALEEVCEIANKVVVVCNSARTAHQLFEKYKVQDISVIPEKHRMRFGRAKLGDLIKLLEKCGIEQELLDELYKQLFRQDDIALADIPKGMQIKLQLQDVVACSSDILERQCLRIKRALWDKNQRQSETWESILNNRSFPCKIIASVRKQLECAGELEQQQLIIDQWLMETVDRLSSISDDVICCQADDYRDLTNVFMLAGLDKELAFMLVKRLSFEMVADPSQIPIRKLSHRPVYLRMLDFIVEKEQSKKIKEAIMVGLKSGELNVECRHIGLLKGMDIPIIVYSGSMAKWSREGLINVFADLERAVLISTSAVEVGVDFDADAIITEECEASSFLQRFGRVGRHGTDSNAIVLVRGDVYAKLNDLNNLQVSREDFCSRILEVFPRRNYANASQLLDAMHYLVNEQLGRIGEQLNKSTGLVDIKPIADQIHLANIQLGFGLRSTMPQITLRDGVTKDPFYLLRYVDDDVLHASDSPFEVARAKVWFTNLIFKRAKFDIIVDLEETLKASRHLFLSVDKEISILSRPSAAINYLCDMNAYFSHHSGWKKMHQGNLLLLHGDVYLSRVDKEVPHTEPVCDHEQNPLFIPNQNYLILWGWTDIEETRLLLEGAKSADWDELYYDWDGLGTNISAKAMVILEKTTGACFAAYKELIQYVSRKI